MIIGQRMLARDFILKAVSVQLYFKFCFLVSTSTKHFTFYEHSSRVSCFMCKSFVTTVHLNYNMLQTELDLKSLKDTLFMVERENWIEG